jgi:hypothetical protein
MTEKVTGFVLLNAAEAEPDSDTPLSDKDEEAVALFVESLSASPATFRIIVGSGLRVTVLLVLFCIVNVTVPDTETVCS